jgi:putative colanic acid biosynthesis UDP-glucose lipid carrier transferase
MTVRKPPVDMGNALSFAAAHAYVKSLDVSEESQRIRRMNVIKRAVDIVLASAFLLASAPLLIVIAALIWWETPGPIVFAQFRLRRGGLMFRQYKFRTMRVIDRIDGADVDGARVTGVGAVLRRTSLDELPQLINVIRGDMSLIGPKPLLGRDAIRYAELSNRSNRILMVRPGLTGPSQLAISKAEADETDVLRQRLQLDLDYIENWSPLLDARLCLMTVRQLLTGRIGKADRSDVEDALKRGRKSTESAAKAAPA